MDPLEDEENVDDEDAEKQECYNCGENIPLYKLRQHMTMCSEDHSKSTQEVTLHVNDGENSGDDVLVSYLKPASASTSSECQNDKTAAISQLHDMFPGESDNTLQQTLQSSINMEDAVDKLLNSEFSDISDVDEILPDLNSILKVLAPKSLTRKRISVSREDLFTDSICIFKAANFNFDQPIKVTFENEPGIDGGGPRREYFSLLLKELVSLRSSVRLFEGNENRLLPLHNTDALRSGLFKVAGRMITSSIINGAPGFPCLAPAVYSYLTSGSMNEAVEMATVDDIPDLEMREVLSKLGEIKEFDHVPEDVSSALIDAGFTKRLNRENKASAIVCLIFHCIIASRKAELDQLSEGLDRILQQARKYPDLCKPLLVYDEETNRLNPDNFKALLHTHGLDEKLKEFFFQYIDSKDEDGIVKLLSFSTGLSSIPPLGLTDPTKISVSSIDSSLPNANTCPMELELPARNSTFEEFSRHMDVAMVMQTTGFGVP